jgi:hypothetical protein
MYPLDDSQFIPADTSFEYSGMVPADSHGYQIIFPEYLQKTAGKPKIPENL